MQAWKVFNGRGKLIDTVFFLKGISAEMVRFSLLVHDNFPCGIRVEKG